MSDALYEARHNLLQQLAAVEVQIAKAYVTNHAQNEAGLDMYAVTQMNLDSVRDDLEDAIEHLLNCPLMLMTEAMDAAGYTADDIHDAFDAGDKWVFVYEDQAEGGYGVGLFTKPTATKAGDYYGEPLSEGADLPVAIAIAKAVSKAASK